MMTMKTTMQIRNMAMLLIMLQMAVANTRMTRSAMNMMILMMTKVGRVSRRCL